MIDKLYENLIKSPITSLIGLVACGFTMFGGETAQTIVSSSPLIDTVSTIAKNVQSGWGVAEWIQFLSSIALMFYAKDTSFKKEQK